MKQRSTTPVSASLATKSALVACAVLTIIATPIQMGSVVLADTYDDQIKSIQKDLDQYQGEAAKLSKKADSYQVALNKLVAEKQVIQTQIDLSQAKHDKFTTEIKQNEKKIAVNKDALGKTIADIYTDSDITPLEMVAGSGNVAEVVDSFTQQAAVQDKLNETIEEIKTLKQRLEKQREGVKRELLNQRAQRGQLASKEAEQQRLVNETRGKESEYKKLSGKKSREIDRLRAEQAEANRRAMEAAAAAAAAANSAPSGGGNSWANIPSGTPGGGGYPGVWANAPLDAYIDSWGLYTRECVSYVAWKIASTGRFVPHFGGAGDARQWPSTVAQYGIKSGSTPVAGSAAVMYGGAYGHVMYVESVNGDGTITVSDYNLMVDGLYRHYTRPAGGLTYVYF